MEDAEWFEMDSGAIVQGHRVDPWTPGERAYWPVRGHYGTITKVTYDIAVGTSPEGWYAGILWDARDSRGGGEGVILLAELRRPGDNDPLIWKAGFNPRDYTTR